jgi:pimeloyl-ACP methyl ester carboxylesterase
MSSRGRSASGEAAVQAAMERLLAAGGVRARSTFLSTPSGRVHYLEAGAGNPTVLLHGGSGGGANWFRIIGRLARGARVLAPDLPGFGLTAAVQPEPPLGSQGATFLADWLDTLGVGPIDLVGTSFGGLAALRLAQRQPQRIRRLVLLDAAGLGHHLPVAVRTVGLPLVGRLALRPSRLGTRLLLRRLLTAGSAGLGATLEAALIEYLRTSGRNADLPSLARAHRLFIGRRGQREVLSDEELVGMDVPVLVVWGERDRLLPVSHGRRAARLIPRSVFHLIPDAGHSPNWEAPAALLRVLLPFLGLIDAPPAPSLPPAA